MKFLILVSSKMLLIVMGGTMLLLIGCAERSTQEESPVAQEEPEYVIAVVVDLSGSFSQEMQQGKGKAYQFLLRVVDQFQRNRAGNNDRLVIAQLSRNLKSLLWDGRPRILRREFSDEKAFHDYLLSKSDPAGSPVFRSVADTLEYVMRQPGFREGKTRSAVLLLSDLEDNDPEKSTQRARMVQSLNDYGKCGGIVGVYWALSEFAEEWRGHLKNAKLRDWVVSEDIRVDPPLPKFE